MLLKCYEIWNRSVTNRIFSLACISLPKPRNANSLDVVNVLQYSLDAFPTWDYKWDKLPASKKTGTKRFVLVRSGQNERKTSNPDSTYLTKLGEKQAKLTGERLKQLYPKVEMVVSSQTPCCLKTASIIAGEFKEKQPNLEIKKNSLIIDVPLPSDPPVPKLSLDERRMFSGIPVLEAFFRNTCFRPVSDDRIVLFIVAESNFIRYFICRALQFPIDHWIRFSLKHGSISEIALQADGTVRLRCAGEAAHLTKDLRSC